MKFNTDYQGLCHHFIYNSDYSECYGNRMFTENDKIYSYGRHFVAGEKVRDSKTNEILFIALNSDSYSVTTSKQMGCLRYAIPSNWSTIEFSDCQWKDGLKTLISFERQYLDLMQKSIKARQRKEEYLNDAARTLENAKLYFELSQRAGVKFDGRKLNTFWKGVFNGESVNAEQLQIEREQRAKNERAAKAKANRKLHADELKALNEWKTGERDYLRYQSTISGAYLRIKGDNVETSENASVSVKAAKLLCKMIQAGKDIKGYNIEGYTVISLNGTLKIGCHDIPRSEVERITKELL